MAHFRTNRLFDAIFLLALIGLLAWAAVNRTDIGDRIYFLSYQPDARIAQLAADAGFSDLGRRLFYRTNPQLVSKTDLAAQCGLDRLGCLTKQGQTYILDQPDNHNQAVVTTGHEMLHFAYRRLPEAQKQHLWPLLDQATATYAGSALAYQLHNEPNLEDRLDESHSLLGTEYPTLPDELERHYSAYFTDRSKILAAGH